MSFQTPRSVDEMLSAIHRHEYLMPAIQREFVWNTDQIIRLVDSWAGAFLLGAPGRGLRACVAEEAHVGVLAALIVGVLVGGLVVSSMLEASITV